MTGGPPPKRDAERRRRNKRAIATTTVDVATLVKQEVQVPVPSDKWHPAAVQWYTSLARSGQVVFYEPSDWALAYVTAENLSRELNPKMQQVGLDEHDRPRYELVSYPMAGSAMAAFLKANASLMVSEAERRRLSIELERRRDDAELPEGVVDIKQARMGHFS